MNSSSIAYNSIRSDMEIEPLSKAPKVTNNSSPPTWTWRQRNLQGWRFGIFSGALFACAVLIVNTSIAASAVARQRGQASEDAQITLFEGDCERVRRLNIGAHAMINILSTILLGASNYAMQCLSAPTRTEIDIAHGKRKWLDIGIPSVRNLGRISKRRALLWLLLVSSSLPLHLL